MIIGLIHLHHRFWDMPPFSQAIWQFTNNISEMKNLVARDYEDMLQVRLFPSHITQRTHHSLSPSYNHPALPSCHLAPSHLDLSIAALCLALSCRCSASCPVPLACCIPPCPVATLHLAWPVGTLHPTLSCHRSASRLACHRAASCLVLSLLCILPILSAHCALLSLPSLLGQCSIPAFEGLLEEEHNKRLMKLLYQTME